MLSRCTRLAWPVLVCAGLLAGSAGCGTAGTPMKGTPLKGSPAGKGSSRGAHHSADKTGTTAHRRTATRTPAATTGSKADRSENAVGAGGALHVVGFAVNARHASFEAVSTVPRLVSEVAPFWYSVQPTGTVTAMKNAQTEAWAHKNGVPLMPLFNNAGSTSAVLTSPGARGRAVANIASIVKANGYDGASVDFQGLNAAPAVRTGLVRFVSALATKLHADGKRVTVNVIPTRQATAAHGAYDETALAKSADQIILMAYDRHSAGSAAGPVAPMPWVKQAVSHALRAGVKPAQLLLGVANYGYDWTGNSTKATTVGYKDVVQMHAKPTWDATNGEYHFSYTKGGTTHTVWYEGTRSMAEKVSLAKTSKLSGIAVWRLGYENTAWWTALQKQVGNHVAKGGTVEGRPMGRGTGTGTGTSTSTGTSTGTGTTQGGRATAAR